MPITIGSNIASLKAQRQLGRATDALATTYERLSSGQRINRASDDSAGLAIASSLNASAKIYTQAIRNLNDGISALPIAEGALDSLTSIVTRQSELAEQSANGTYSLTQRKALQNESDALTREYNRIIASTEFNGRKLLNGDFRNTTLQAGFGTNAILSISTGDGLAVAQGSGTLNVVQTFAWVGQAPPIVGDFNGDGRDDFVTQNNIRLANADGTFGAATVIASGGAGTGYNAFGVADFNGDGKLDLLEGDPNNAPTRFAIHYGNGNGTFGAIFTFDEASGVADVDFGDFNGDGKVDIITRRNASNALDIYINLGDGTFGSPTTTLSISQPANLSVGDFNQDGKDDIALVTGVGNISYALANSNGMFNAFNNIGAFGANGSGESIIADFNRDGFLDLYATANGQGGRFLAGRGDGSFNTYVSVSDPFNGGFGSTTDYNRDGILDIVITNAASFTYRIGRGDGTFDTAVSLAIPIAGNSSTFGDFNGDGVLDVAGSVFGGNTAVYISSTQSQYNAQYLSILSADDARNALTTIDQIRARISKETGNIGAYQPRISVAEKTSAVARENYIAAESRISDADVATESANLLRQQILQQAASSVLAQANQSPNLALRLLQN